MRLIVNNTPFEVRAWIGEQFPELAENDDERVRKELLNHCIRCAKGGQIVVDKNDYKRWAAWLEKQGEQKPVGDKMLCNPDKCIYVQECRKKQKPLQMIQWNGNNLKEVVEFTGKSPNFDKWFKSQEEYEGYVRSHNNIFKLFNEDGSHCEIPVGAWIIKTQDGYNVASKFGFVPKPEYPLAHEKMETERWKEACKAACSDRNYRSHYGLTETRDDYFVDGVHWADEHPKQKPVEWSEEDLKWAEEVRLALRFYSKDKQFVERLTNWFDNHIQPQQEWSEEDKKYFNILLSLAHNPSAAGMYDYHQIDKSAFINWIKFLHPQKQWNVVDKEIYVKEPALAQRKDKSAPNHGYVICYDHTLTPDVYERYIMLNDEHPQKRWKPTEEQINALSITVKYGHTDDQEALEGLLEQLKAL